MMKNVIGSILLICAMSLQGAATRASDATIVLLNGDVYTMEENHPWAKAVVITGNTLTAVLDTAAHAKPYIGPATKVYDLKGKFIIPGFIDCHVHCNDASRRFGDGLNGNLGVLEIYAKYGIVEIHDIEYPDHTSKFIALEDQGKLTCRVWLRPNLFRSEELAKNGFKPGLHPKTKKPSNFLRYGSLKGYMDGIMGDQTALFFEKYDDKNTYGIYNQHSSTNGQPDLEKFYRLIKTAHTSGFYVDCHAIGDKGNHLVLSAYERLKQEIPAVDMTKWRIIHGQVCRLDDFSRFAKLGIFVEANPNHILLDMKWMEPHIGFERCKGAYAFKTYLDNGVRLCFGSDHAGSPVEAYQPHPKYLLHGAVNRQKTDGTPKEGWFPEQRISMAEALKAYTLRGAEAAFAGDIRGSLKEGKLADIVVIDRNLMTIDPLTVLDMKINMTIVDGRIVFSELQPSPVSVDWDKAPAGGIRVSASRAGGMLTIDFPESAGDVSHGAVTVAVYNLNGSIVYSTMFIPSGKRFVWDGTAKNGGLNAAGFYCVKITFGARTVSRKLYLARTER